MQGLAGTAELVVPVLCTTLRVTELGTVVPVVRGTGRTACRTQKVQEERVRS